MTHPMSSSSDGYSQILVYYYHSYGFKFMYRYLLVSHIYPRDTLYKEIYNSVVARNL